MGDRLHRVTPLHGDAGFSSGLVVLGVMGTAVPHAWRLPLAAAVVLRLCRPIPLLEDRVRAQHLMRGCAPTKMSEATTSAAVPMGQRVEEKGNN